MNTRFDTKRAIAANRLRRVRARGTADRGAQRVATDHSVCPVCGEKLSGPAWLYVCPRMPVESIGRVE